MVFLFVLFFTKNKTIFTNKPENGLVYNGNEKVGDLVNKDTDGDGVVDWQEGLFGTDPTKDYSNPDGTSDKAYIARMGGEDIDGTESNFDTLNQTDKFSRELFSTVATLNQTGGVDQTTIDKLSDSLVLNLQNSGNTKVFLYSDLKIINVDTKQAIKTYNDTLNKIYTKYPIKYTVLDVLQKFIIDENTVDESVLVELDPIIKQTNNIINEMAKMNVPSSLALLHLETLNNLEKVSENTRDIRLYATDPIVAMASVGKYQENATNFQISLTKLGKIVAEKLK